MVEKGVVGDVRDGKIFVNIARHPACIGCRACNIHEGRVMRIEFENTIGAKKGDRINIELDDYLILKGAFLFYVVPLLGLVLGLFLGRVAAKNMNLGLPDEIVSAACGITIMIMTFIIIKKYNLANGKMYKPRISQMST